MHTSINLKIVYKTVERDRDLRSGNWILLNKSTFLRLNKKKKKSVFTQNLSKMEIYTTWISFKLVPFIINLMPQKIKSSYADWNYFLYHIKNLHLSKDESDFSLNTRD